MSKVRRKPARHLDNETKLAALARMKGGENVSLLAQELGVVRRTLYHWRTQLARAPSLRGPGRPRPAEQQASKALSRPANEATPADELKAAREQVAALERKIGQQQLELDFFRRALQAVRGAPQASAAPGGATSTRSSRR